MNKDSQLDDKLTDFTDRVLAGKSAHPDSSADDELRRLEETIIRLKRALPRTEADQSTLNQIEARLTARLRKEMKSTTTSVWHTWFGRKHDRSRTQPLAFGFVLIVLVALVTTFMIPSGGSGVAASVFVGTRVALTTIALTGLLLALIWFLRRK